MRKPTEEERKAIASLRRLAKRWPKTLELASMGGRLIVVFYDDDDFNNSMDPATRQRNVLADLGRDIPNTGGDW